MNKSDKYNGPKKVHNPVWWPLDSKAFEFIRLTDTACFIEELEKVRN
jgi:hypothetical protein